MKKILRAIGDLFKRVFGAIIKDARQFVKPSVKFVQILKAVVDSAAADAVVNYTKTDIDNRALDRLRKILPGILHMMALTDGCITEGATNDQIIQCALAKIKVMHPDLQKSTWLGLAGHLSAALSDGRFTFGEVVGLAWYIYHSEVQEPATLPMAA